MYLYESRNAWSYHQGPEPTVDFCLWILQVDGLHVSPFDQHSGGDGSLRAIGLTAENWQSWLLRVLDHKQQERDVQQLQRRTLGEYLGISKEISESDIQRFNQRFQAEYFNVSASKELSESDVQQLQRRVLAQDFNVSKDLSSPLPPFHHLLASWSGSSAVRNTLIELQERYKQETHQHEMWYSDFIRALHKDEHHSSRSLYDELKPYYNRIPPLRISFAVYEYPLDYIVYPATLLVTVQEGQPEPQEYRERVLNAVAELAAQPVRRGKHSLYTREVNGAGQFITAHRRHARKPAPVSPPSASRQKIPRLEDPVKQVVFEHLADKSLQLAVPDLTTVQFLREKNRPGWRLYEVTFQEIDGEQHRQIVILQQNEDGTWRFRSGGSRGDIQNKWHTMVAPVHDHPLLFLSVAGEGPIDQQMLLVAHGDVIDNGFHVKQVRLVNNAGEVLEDTVEDRFVFFAREQGKRASLPMQAELYDNEGKLVWRQTVAIQRLPPWLKRKKG